jgi:hypothetical protein
MIVGLNKRPPLLSSMFSVKLVMTGTLLYLISCYLLTGQNQNKNKSVVVHIWKYNIISGLS